MPFFKFYLRGDLRGDISRTACRGTFLLARDHAQKPSVEIHAHTTCVLYYTRTIVQSHASIIVLSWAVMTISWQAFYQRYTAACISSYCKPWLQF